MPPTTRRARRLQAGRFSFTPPQLPASPRRGARPPTARAARRRRSAPPVTCAHRSAVTRRQALSLLALLAPRMWPLCAARAAPAPAAPDAQPLPFETLPCVGEQCRAVQYHDYRVGSGRAVQPGSVVVLKWTGRLADRYGWPIQNEDADEIRITLGKDSLIRGFEMALMGMCEGGKRRMLIPSELGYLDQRSGPLPASYGDRRRLFATVLNQRRFKRAGDLVIDVQLLKVRNPQQ